MDTSINPSALPKSKELSIWRDIWNTFKIWFEPIPKINRSTRVQTQENQKTEALDEQLEQEDEETLGLLGEPDEEW